MADTLQIWPTNGNPNWEDGDPFDLFMQCQILRTNAWALIRDQYGKHHTLLEPYLAATCSLKFERISKTEFRRTDLVTSDVEIVGPKANAAGRHSHVEEYLADIRRAGKVPIFGTRGSEIVYDGGVPLDDARASAIWDAMEAGTSHRRTDHLDWRAQIGDLRGTLLVEIEPVTREERATILESDANGKRSRVVDWENLPGMDAAKIAAIRDPRQSVDYRKVLPRVLKAVVVPRSVEAIT